MTADFKQIKYRRCPIFETLDRSRNYYSSQKKHRERSAHITIGPSAKLIERIKHKSNGGAMEIHAITMTIVYITIIENKKGDIMVNILVIKMRATEVSLIEANGVGMESATIKDAKKNRFSGIVRHLRSLREILIVCHTSYCLFSGDCNLFRSLLEFFANVF